MITKQYIGADAYQILGIDNEFIDPIEELTNNMHGEFTLERVPLVMAAVSHIPALLGLSMSTAEYSQTNTPCNLSDWQWNWHNDFVGDYAVDCKMIMYFVSEPLTTETGNRICFRETNTYQEHVFNVTNRSIIIQRSDVNGVFQHKREHSRKPISSRKIVGMNCLGFDDFLKYIPNSDKY